MELFNAVQYCWNNLKGKNAPITQKKEKKNNKYLQITYKVRGCHKLYILLATPSSPMSLWLCQKMSEIYCGGEGSTITNILKSLDQVARFLPCPKFELNSFSNTHGTQPELLWAMRLRMTFRQKYYVQIQYRDKKHGPLTNKFLISLYVEQSLSSPISCNSHLADLD